MNGWTWAGIAIIYGLGIFQVGLGFAPKVFWRNLDAQHPNVAAYLWGFSHLWPPMRRTQAGELKPWYR
jgi:hypothetical protein